MSFSWGYWVVRISTWFHALPQEPQLELSSSRSGAFPLQVFQFLTAWAGDAYLQYSTDKRLLFTMGVSLSVRPDQHRFILWGPGRGCHA